MDLAEFAAIKAKVAGVRPRVKLMALLWTGQHRRVHAIGENWIRIYRGNVKVRINVSEVKNIWTVQEVRNGCAV